MSTAIEETTLATSDLAVSKSNMIFEQDQVVANGFVDEDNDEAVAELPAAPKKTPAKRNTTPKKNAAEKKDDNESAEPTTPKPAKKRTSKPKKENAMKSEGMAENGDAGSVDEVAATPATPTLPAAASSSKKRVAKADKGDTETPTKKRKTKAEANGGSAETPAKAPKAKATPKKTPAKAKKFPESWEEFSEGDKLLVRMRKEGKGWDEIEKAWTAVTGQIPGKDVLRKKETKLRALAVEWKAGDARKLADFKAKVDEESAAAFKKLEVEKWIKMVEMFKAAGSEYSSPGLQKKWELMVKKGEVNSAGEYIGDDVSATEAAKAAEGSNAEAADADMKEDGDVDAENEDGSEAADADTENA